MHPVLESKEKVIIYLPTTLMDFYYLVLSIFLVSFRMEVLIVVFSSSLSSIIGDKGRFKFAASGAGAGLGSILFNIASSKLADIPDSQLLQIKARVRNCQNIPINH